jgi:hypothetical protein
MLGVSNARNYQEQSHRPRWARSLSEIGSEHVGSLRHRVIHLCTAMKQKPMLRLNDVKIKTEIKFDSITNQS